MLPKGLASLEIFLSLLEKELFTDDFDEPSQNKLSAEEWKALRNLASDHSIVIKGVDKGSSVVVWDRTDYKLKNILRTNEYIKNILTSLVEKRNKIINHLCSHRLISESELKYFTYNLKKATSLGKLYFLPKIHKRLANVQGRPFISNCATPTEKVSEYLDFPLKPVMQDGWSYITDIGHFLKRTRRLGEIPEGAILVDVVGLYPNIPHDLGLQSLRKRLNETGNLKYLLKRSLQWQSLFSKAANLSLMKKFADNYLEQLLELNLQHLTLGFPWMKLKPVFLKHNNCSHSF